jgi:D-arabinose 1-dehydrogenase-like Zn-dependent alcohol dehydrogenase
MLYYNPDVGWFALAFSVLLIVVGICKGAMIAVFLVKVAIPSIRQRLGPGFGAAGRLVINAIRKEDVDKAELLRLDYGAQLWMEREIVSVANVTRQDVREGLALAAEMGLRPEVQEFPLQEANRALVEVRMGLIRGAKVLRIG